MTPLLVALALACRAAAEQDPPSWATLHGDLQRSGFYSHFPSEGLKLVWRKELWKEMTGPRCEVIVGGGLAFMGTYQGKIYAWDAQTGEEKWVVQTGGPIGHSPMFESGVLYVGSMDRKMYALEASTGKEKWRFEAGEGIWTSPVAADGRVLFGARDGVFCALGSSDGKLLWRFRTQDRILTSASMSPDRRRVIFASEDMHVYCLDPVEGRLVWTSRRLEGQSVRDYAPTVVDNLVLVTTNPVMPFHPILNEQQELLLRRTGFRGKDNRYIFGTAQDVEKEEEAILEHLKTHPDEQTFYAFRLEDGREPWVAPIFYTSGLHNPPTPPCVNKKTGEVYVLTRSAYGVWDGGGEVRPYTGVGKLDLGSGRVSLVEHGHPSPDPSRPAGQKDMPFASFNTIGDETQTLSCSPDYLLCNHQGTLGSMHLGTGKLRALFGKRDSYGGFYGPATFGWEDQGGPERARQAGQPYGLVNEWHGPARAIVSVVGPRVYFPVGSQVLCLEGK
jgi:outer membrane protein assembly factor BamB